LYAFRSVTCQRDIDRNTQIRIGAKCGCGSAAQADFFLHAEHEVDFVRGTFQAAQYFHLHGHADAIIHRF
jgi:hypothetical protein